MPKFDSKAESQSFELLDGDYRFEIVAVDSAISQGNKTRGSDVREVKLKFFKDANFTQPAAQWMEDFIYHYSTEWKCSVFARCVGKHLADGAEFDIDASWIGHRGWATCKPEEDRDKTKIDTATNKVRRYNRVRVFITNKEKIAARVIAPTPADDVELGPDGKPLPF